MGTSQLIGYAVSVAGLATLVLSTTIASLPVIKSLSNPTLYTAMGGFILVAAGVALVLSGESSSKIKQATEEVPIYEGTGKKRKIVGYQKADR